METNRPAHPDRIALISPPWPLYTRPSIQIGALKAFVRSRFPAVEVSAHHVYLRVAEAIGYKQYHAISERTWLAESVFAALLYPDRAETIARLFRREASGNPELRGMDFARLAARVEAVTEAWISSANWDEFRLLGFTSVLCQLTACLYLIRKLKQRHPRLTMAVGGSAFSAESAPAALKLFPEIDVVVFGEGELPLAHLVQHHVLEHVDLAALPPANGIQIRGQTASDRTPRDFYQLENLDLLPHPDFDDFFEVLSGFDPLRRFFPTLPVEISRGCWWQRPTGPGPAEGCAFCNLNLQWHGYRAKSAPRVVAEIDRLTSRYKTLSVAIMDNVLPKESTADILRGLSALKKDIALFAEIRATTPFEELKLMRAAGLRTVQVGIEALSTRLLRKLRKGTTAIQNLEIMKHCEALGIANLANIIAHFPGSDEQDVHETLRAIEFAFAFRPPKFVSFWLGSGSPVWNRPEDYGIRDVANHPHWRKLFPPSVFRNLPLTVQSYRGGLSRQRTLWQPVRQKISAWEKAYSNLHQTPFHEPILTYRDGGDFMIIRERRPAGESASHRLEGKSRQIYLFCEHHRPLKRILESVPRLSQNAVTDFLNTMIAQKLVFEENGTYLSLAVPEKSTLQP
jgi:ribosomal peptide maturation radical SAM protein 1